MTDGVWGLTRKMDIVHIFRKRIPSNGKYYADMTIHPTSKGRGHGYLFIPRPGWDPHHPLTCPECLKLLEFEQEVQEKTPLPVSP